MRLVAPVALGFLLITGCGTTALPSGEQYTITVPQPDSVRVLSRASRSSAPLAYANPGDTLRVIGATTLRDFLRVRYGAVEGFVYAEHVGVAGAGGLGGVVREYDRFDDATVFKVSPFYVRRLSLGDLNNHTMQMSALYTCPGRTECSPDAVLVMLFSDSKDHVFLRSHDVTILADGQRFAYPEPERRGDVYLGGVRESIAWTMSRSDFIQFTRADSVDVRVGTVEFAIPPSRRAPLMDLAQAMPSAQP